MLWTLLLCIVAADASTVTYLFSDARYLDMTLDVAHATYRLARRDPHDYRYRMMVRIWLLDDTPCEAVVPFTCLRMRARSDDYFALIAHRMTVLLAALEFPESDVDGILMLDSDVALWRNTADRMALYNTSLVFQRELPCGTRRCVNAGVWWARTNDEGALRVVRHAHRLMRTLRLPDQDALDAALTKHRNVTVAMLPVDRYPNGFVFGNNDRLVASRVHLVHTNWCSFVAKQSRLAQLARRSGTYLAPPSDTNRTVVCDALWQLDAANLRHSLLCAAAECSETMLRRCPPQALN